MLVLSRRASETIRFPQLGISVSILSVKGNRVQVGVDAPAQIQIVRKELESVADTNGKDGMANSIVSNSLASVKSSEEKHALKNRLNRAMLALQLTQKQLSAGQLESADKTLAFALARLAELEDGSCSKNECEIASTFADSFPAPKEMSGGSTMSLSSRATAKPIEVLLVEDDLNEQALLRTLLEMEGYRVHTAKNGREALECLSRSRPVCVLLDMMMPECDGAETLERIRAISRFNELPVYAVSGTSPESVGVSVGTDGVDDWFPKPLNASRLVQHMRRRFSDLGNVNSAY